MKPLLDMFKHNSIKTCFVNNKQHYQLGITAEPKKRSRDLILQLLLWCHVQTA